MRGPDASRRQDDVKLVGKLPHLLGNDVHVVGDHGDLADGDAELPQASRQKVRVCVLEMENFTSA